MPSRRPGPIRIVHVVKSFGTGGMENGLVNLINRTDPGRFQHRICCLSCSGASAGRLLKPMPIDEMGKQGGNSVGFLLRLADYFRQSGPDIVHTRTWGGLDGVPAARLARVPAIVHGEHGFHPDDPFGKNRRKKWIRRMLSLWVDRYVTVSQDLAQWLRCEIGIRKPVVTIHNGVDTDRFRPAFDKEDRKAAFGLTGKQVVGAVGRLDPIKRHDLLIESFCGLASRHPESVLVIVGDGAMRQRLESITQRLDLGGRVHLLGERNDLPTIYPMMDLFVQPSDNEGISNTILEAMACEVPVLATAVGGNPELVESGATGQLIQPGSSRELLETISDYLADPEKRLKHGKRARRVVEEQFSIGRMVSAYERLYEDLFVSARR